MVQGSLLTRTKGENVDREEEGGLGASVGKEVLGTGNDHENVGDTENNDTPANKLEAASLCVGQPAEEEGKGISQHGEGLSDGVGGTLAQTEGTGCLLSATGRSTPTVAAFGHGTVDIVADQGLDTVVRRSLAELDNANQISNDGESAGHTAERVELLLGGLALVVVLDGDVLVGGAGRVVLLQVIFVVGAAISGHNLCRSCVCHVSVWWFKTAEMVMIGGRS